MTTELREVPPEAIIMEKIATLQSHLLSNHPQMPMLLFEIHKALKENPAVVTLLPEDQIHVIINGLEKQTNTYLAQTLTKAKGPAKEKLKNVKNSDLGFDD